MDIIARTFGTVAELYTRLKRQAAKVGLVVNAAKTKYMLVGGTERDGSSLGSDVTHLNSEPRLGKRFAENPTADISVKYLLILGKVFTEISVNHYRVSVNFAEISVKSWITEISEKF